MTSKLKVCKLCKTYTLKQICKKCNEKTSDAHYKFMKVKDAPKRDIKTIKKN